MAAVSAFREKQVTLDMFNEDNFTDFDARRMRYQILWAFYENTAYRNVHTWATRYKADYGLYRYTRNIYNPVGRIIDFWQMHLLGGELDPEAGDGSETPSALPIVTENEALRPAIAKLWQWSNWQQKKDILGLFGPCLGDVGIKIVDDVGRNKVYLQTIHPRTIKSMVKDDFGHIKAYALEEMRDDPRNPHSPDVTYNEIVTRDENGRVFFATTLNGHPYPWNGEEAEWEIDYGFVPFVHIPHIDVDIDWGWSEVHKARSKVHEADDLVSKLDDQIRKTVDSPWLFTGMKKPSSTPTVSGSDYSTDRPQPGREEIPAFYSSDPGSQAIPLVAPLDIAATSEHIASVLQDIERDYPELKLDILNFSGDISGRALAIARQPVVVKVQQRRVAYDRGGRDAQAMAIAIAGDRKVDPAFNGFDLTSYDKGDLNHIIGNRPVFEKTVWDEMEMNQAFWEAAEIAVNKVGVPLESYLESQGWEPEQVRKLMRPAQRQAVRSAREAARNRRSQNGGAAGQTGATESGTPSTAPTDTEGNQDNQQQGATA